MNPQPKSRPVRSEAYRRAVAALSCYCCGRAGPSQAAHADYGKGMGIKSSDTTCYPLCPTCHSSIGAGAMMNKNDRRVFETKAWDHTTAQLYMKSAVDKKLATLLTKLGLLR
jgi:hypothetical protein